jgi:16S rRNA (uracil1498-N3)-methyltransferase
MSSTPPHFRIDSTAVSVAQARITGAELHHLRDVTRLRPGDAVALIDERGRNYRGRIVSLDAAAAVIGIDGVEEPRTSPPLIIALAIIKGPRMDLAIEKTAELGATEFWPLVCERCVARDPGPQRLARWRRLAAAACKQSLSARPMEVKAPIDFHELPARAPKEMLQVICQAGAPPLAVALNNATRAGILIVCGPEGDFTAEEMAAAEDARFVRARLGSNRLRSETAAIAALAMAAPVLDALS